jgi:endonuclease G
MKTSMHALAALAVLLPAAVHAAPEATNCPADYLGGKAPDVLNPKLMTRVREICFRQFGVFHSGVTATPLWSAEHLTADMVTDANEVDRDDVFHAEPSLPPSERAELSHYRGSGYDRGHMAPAADMVTKEGQDESFSLANMVPQEPSLNRGPWARIELTARKLARRYGEVYMVTGPVFSGDRIARIGGRVFVPSFVYKAVYIPKTGQSSVWWADNATDAITVISVAELSRRAGIDVFPAASASSKAAVVALPVPSKAATPKSSAPREQTAKRKPSSRNSGLHARRGGEAGWIEALFELLAALVDKLVRLVIGG